MIITLRILLGILTVFVQLPLCIQVSQASQKSVAQISRDQGLITAVKKGDLLVVKRLLKQGADPNAREIVLTKPDASENSPGGQKRLADTALMIAIQQGQRAIALLLLQNGADVNGRGAYGYTPLIEAVRNYKDGLAELLLQRGAKPDLRNETGDTAIVFAANQGQNNLIKALLQKGADINGGTGRTPLIEATDTGWKETVVLLLKQGAKVNFTRGDAFTPLEIAILNKNEEIAAILRKAGGKARTLEELQRPKDTMPEDFAAHRKQQAQKWKHLQALTEDDQGVIETALTDFRNYKGKDLYWQEKGTELLLHTTTTFGSGMISDSQLNGELDDRQANDITLPMRKHLQQRNWESVSIESLKFSDKHILRMDLKEHMDDLTFSKSHPKAKAWVEIYLPGYSEQHDKAVLRFHFGPSPHGASATYFLIKKNGKWQIKWRDFAYYV